jgi:hypothetical protein
MDQKGRKASTGRAPVCFMFPLSRQKHAPRGEYVTDYGTVCYILVSSDQ